jgi:hypothetical protein
LFDGKVDENEAQAGNRFPDLGLSVELPGIEPAAERPLT